jgi:branched-chain amino acid transport system permease protein
MAMGLIFVILAAGFVLIVSVSRILLMAYGAFYTIGAYATWYAVKNLNFPYLPSLVIGISVAVIITILSYILVFRRLTHTGGFLATLMAAMGLSMVLTQGGILVYGTVPRSIPTVFSGMFNVFGVIIGVDKLVLITVSIIVTALLFLVYEKTSLGRQLRAVEFLPEAASLQGVNIDKIYLVALGLGCALAAFAGGILAPSYGINPEMGNYVFWTILLLTMLGGADSLLGAVVGGLIIGQLLSFGQYFIGSSIQIVIFLFIGVVLYFKPNGLLGRGIDIGI